MRPISAPVLALLLLVSLISGLVLWWPPQGKRLSSLRVRADLGLERAALDVHNVLGVTTAAFLAVALVTGIYLVEPRWLVAPLNVVLPTTPLPSAVTSGHGDVPIGFEQAADLAARQFPDGRTWMIQYPQGRDGTYHVFRPSPDDRTEILPTRQLWLDQYTGAVLGEFGPHTFTAGDEVEQLLYPLHSGEAAGMPGRIVVSMMGWTPLWLFVTGVIRWRQKRRSRLRSTSTVSTNVSSQQP